MLESEFGVATPFRQLGTYEEFIWLAQKTKPVTIVFVATLEGATTAKAWRTALDVVQAHHPILSACIRKRPGSRPYFEADPDKKLALRVLPFDSPTALFDECARELENPFADDEMPLRVTVFHSEQRSTALVSANHVALDGTSVVYVIRDMIRSLAGIVLGPRKPLTPSQDELLGLPPSDTYATTLASPDGPFESLWHPDTRIPARFHIEQAWLEPSTVVTLTERARQEKTTVHGALTAGILLAGRAKSRRWAEATVRCVSPIDNRLMMGLEDELGVQLTLASSELHSAVLPDFWSLARQVRSDILALGNTQAAALSLAPVRDMLSTEMSPTQLAGVFGPSAQTAMVTNYGRVKIASRYGPLRLLSISPMVHSGGPHTQTVSVATLDGLLCMTNISMEPISDLLAGAKALVISHLS